MKKVKELGSVYTPKYIVNLMLDNIEYKHDILQKHIIDNSCGDGAFLIEIVKRYCLEYFRINNNFININIELEKYIHGIEIDQLERDKCIENLNNTVEEFGIFNVNWDILNANSLYVEKYNNKMDFVVGNPPYVRIHNLKDDYNKIKDMKFSKHGMTDLFIVFYEIGLKMLNKDGVLSYITPSSIINSKAGLEFRKFVTDNNLLRSFINLKHYQPFKEATTYTGIFTISSDAKDKDFRYYEYDGNDVELISTSNINNHLINNVFYFGKLEDIELLKNIFNWQKDNFNISVKNGLATLSDDIFIKDNFDFESYNNVISIFKGSTGKVKKAIFPYDKDGNILDFEKLDNIVQKYFLDNKEKLTNRSIDKNSPWFAYGRSQGIKDINKNKIIINTLVKDKKDIKLNLAKKGTGVYSGLYITGKLG